MEPMFLKLAEPLRLASPSIEACFVLEGQPKGDWLMTMNYDEFAVERVQARSSATLHRSTEDSS